MAIDILESKVVGTNKETWYKLIGTPTDTKPTGEFPAGTGHTVAKDSTFFEIGTQIRYEFDGSAWNPKGQVPVTLIEKEITQNGVYSASDDNADGYSSVDVDVEINVGTKSIIENGTYSASSDELDGYSQVTVNVPEQNNAKFGVGTDDFEPKNLVKLIIPDGVTSLKNQGFANYKMLEYVEIPSSVTTIKGENAFDYCTKLTSIVVHKAEGSISGAPWGATNAQVIWDG